MTDTHSEDESETVSIIVPVYNDPEGITATLDSLVPQLREAAELIVVDNDSTDRTPAVISEYAQKYDRVEQVTEDRIQSSYAARNRGIVESNGSICAFVDADMTVPSDWLERAVEAFTATDAAYMGCNVELVLPDGAALPARYDYHTGFPIEQYLKRQRFAPTCCLFVRQDVFEDVGRFDHRLVSGGDKEFGNRVAEAGYNMYFAADVTMYHPVRDSIPALIKKDHRVGRGLCQLQRYHADRYGRPGIPPCPSGVKSPDPDFEVCDRLAFSVLSKALVAVRGIGYYHEFLRSWFVDTDESPSDP